MTDSNDKKPFWTALPPILRMIIEVIALITALVMLYIVFHPSPHPGFTSDPLGRYEPTLPYNRYFATDGSLSAPAPTPSVTPSPLTVTVQGTVTDGDNMPVEGLKVSVDGGSSDMTYADGTYIMQNVPVGDIIIRVERVNKAIYKRAYQIEGGSEIKVINISIPAEDANNGRYRNTTTNVTEYPMAVTADPDRVVKDIAIDILFNVTSDGLPVENALVTLLGCGVNVSRKTNANGTVNISVTATSTGTIDVTVTKDTYEDATATVTVALTLALPTLAPTKASTKAPTAAPTEIETMELKTEGIPGFGAVFAIAGLLVAAYLVMRRRD